MLEIFVVIVLYLLWLYFVSIETNIIIKFTVFRALQSEIRLHNKTVCLQGIDNALVEISVYF